MNSRQECHWQLVGQVCPLGLAFSYVERGLVLAGLIICLSLINVGRCQDDHNEPLSLGPIIEGIQRSLDKFDSMRIRYTCSSWMWLDYRHVPVRIEAVYAHKLKSGIPRPLQYFDVKVYRVHPNSRTKDIVQSEVVSFDGQVTRKLIRVDHPAVRRKRLLKQGLIQKGFISGYFVFGGGDFGPFEEIWYLGAKTLAGVLTGGEIVFRVAGRTAWEGLETVVIEGLIPRREDDPNSREVCYRFWICPERGYLPVKRVFLVDGQVQSDRGLYDLVRLPNGAWFPRRIQYPADRLAVDKVTMPWVWQIEEISVDPIPDSFFSFKFPAWTRVYDEVKGINYTTYWLGALVIQTGLGLP